MTQLLFGRAGTFLPMARNIVPRAHSENPSPSFAAWARRSLASSSETQTERADRRRLADAGASI